jgi:hypothetical protein
LGLFVAVAWVGANQVMTSPDGINWTDRNQSSASFWVSVCWSPDESLFVAVAYSGTNRVMTSPDGINWTDRNASSASGWRNVCWSPDLGLFVAVAGFGTNRVMTSPDGINWTDRNASSASGWISVCWSPDESLFVAVAQLGTKRIMVSSDGIDWYDSFIDTDDTTISVEKRIAKQQIGVRYKSIAVPAGSTILSAYAKLQVVSETDGENLDMLINGEDDANPAIFSTYANFTGRDKTSAQVTWNGQAWGGGTKVTSPNIKTIIQEIVDLAGWGTGQDMVLFFYPSGSGEINFASFDHASYDEPELVITYASGGLVGRASTCSDEVYVANKDNVAQLTNIYNYDDSGAAFSANLVGETTPFDLLPDPLAVDDCLYLGSTSSTTGPFCSLVFDIGDVADSGAAITWEYWNGAAWAALSIVDDKANYDQFEVADVGALVWIQPASWATTSVNGVTAYWVRARVSTAAGNTPTQQNRDIYTVTKSSVDIDEDEVAGDLTAIAKMNIVTLDTTRGKAEKIIVGLRSDSRGTDFVQHINCSLQNNTDISTTVDNDTAIQADVDRPSNSGLQTQFPDTVMERRFYFEIDPPLSNVYYGRYRAFMRAEQTSGTTISDGDVQSYLKVAMGSSTNSSTVGNVGIGNDWHYFDYGIITIPPAILPEIYEGTVRIDCYASDSSGSIYLDWVDLVLVPVDEYAFELRQNADAINNTGDITTADSLSYIGKSHVFSVLRYESDYEIYDIPTVVASGPIQLQANADQKLFWFVPDASKYEWLGRIQVWKNERYLTFRGDS